MINEPTEDPTTQATIEIGGMNVRDISGFSVSLDIMQLGDPFSLTLPNPRGKWTDKLKAGASVRLKMANPNVNGGRESLMHTGLVTGRQLAVEIGTGSVMQLQCNDIGWHLLHHYPKPHERLEQEQYADLLSWATGESTWGFKGTTTDTTTSQLILRGLTNGRAAAEAAASNNLVIFQAQVEPGMSLASLLVSYAKRFNRLVNVSPDGYIQVFEPNYNQTPLYHIDLHEYDDPDNVKNNVLAAALNEDIEKRWTKVTVVGQVVGYALYDSWGYNPGKFLGYAEDDAADKLPFKHEFSYADGEVYLKDPWAGPAAGWRLKRDHYDTWEAKYRVRGHWQRHNGQSNWWVPDTLCEVRDDVLGIKGTYYVAAVKLDRTRGGDTTEITLKKKDLLSANFVNVLTGKVT